MRASCHECHTACRSETVKLLESCLFGEIRVHFHAADTARVMPLLYWTCSAVCIMPLKEKASGVNACQLNTLVGGGGGLLDGGSVGWECGWVNLVDNRHRL